MSVLDLTSGDSLPELDACFKLTAGPGAGKTYWLACHIKRVLNESEVLHSQASIACITYTQVGADELRDELGTSDARLWIGTIHSFLYAHVVRPYIHLLADLKQEGSQIKGPDRYRPSRGQVEEFLTDVNQSTFMGRSEGFVRDLLADLVWRRDGADWGLCLPKNVAWKRGKGLKKEYLDRPEALLRFKQGMWKRGRISSEDVVYLAARILQQAPVLFEALARRFPYVFVDEFQDTTPVQAEMLTRLAHHGTVMGVVGDRNQAIFEFSEATTEAFDSFFLTGSLLCRISGNRRSTAEIVRVLNGMRNDLVQTSIAPVPNGPRPLVMIGSIQECLTRARVLSNHDLFLLGRAHVAVSALLGVTGSAADVFDDLDDPARALFLGILCKTLRHFEAGQAREAMQELSHLFTQGIGCLKQSPELTRVRRRPLGVFLLEELRAQLRRDPNVTVLDAYNGIQQALAAENWGAKLTKATGGKFVSQAAKVRMADLVSSIRVDNSGGRTRTVHNFKGGEAASVMTYLHSKGLARRLVEPKEDEESRIIYVALSRAKILAMIALEALPEEMDAGLIAAGFDVERLSPGRSHWPSEEAEQTTKGHSPKKATTIRKAAKPAPTSASPEPPTGSQMMGQIPLF